MTEQEHYCVTCGAHLHEGTVRMHNLWHQRIERSRIAWDEAGRQVDASIEKFRAERTRRYAETDRKRS